MKPPKQLNRRAFLRASLSAGLTLLAATLVPLKAWAMSAAEKFSTRELLKEDELEQAIRAYVGDAQLTVSEQLVLNVPTIAENGNAVTIELDARQVAGKVDQIAFFIANNPRPFNSVYHFSSAEPMVNIRVRMLESSQVVAVSRLDNGNYVRNQAHIKVTSGGCGG